MGTETLLLETCCSNGEYGAFGCNSDNNGPPDLLTQWLNSLETRTSLFWLHYVECNFKNNSEEASRFREEKLGSEETDASLSSRSSFLTEETVSDFDSLRDSNSSTSSVEQSSLLLEEAEDGGLSKEVPIIPCKSIAHRDPELLVALSENCSHGAVCYFCRYGNSEILKLRSRI